MKIVIEGNNSIHVNNIEVSLSELKEKIKTHYQKNKENTKVSITMDGDASVKTLSDVKKSKKRSSR